MPVTAKLSGVFKSNATRVVPRRVSSSLSGEGIFGLNLSMIDRQAVAYKRRLVMKFTILPHYPRIEDISSLLARLLSLLGLVLFAFQPIPLHIQRRPENEHQI